jgi:hypothetical protein
VTNATRNLILNGKMEYVNALLDIIKMGRDNVLIILVLFLH